MIDRADVICRHFGTCGGCSYQDMPLDAYRELKRQIVIDALAREGLSDVDVRPIVEIKPATRRRATFKVAKSGDVTLFGFHAAESHTIVDMQECRVLTPALARLVPSLREMMAEKLKEGQEAELYVIQTDNGLDIALHGVHPNAAATTWAARWVGKLRLTRVTVGDQILVEMAAPTVRIGHADIRLPPLAFIQPTREGEEVLQDLVLQGAERAKNITDLFAGVGTFALRLAERARVHAVDADGAAIAALAAAARATQGLKPVTTLSRDLVRSPLSSRELAEFDVAVLDPPRAGASRQVRELARSAVRRVIYVSCNPQSFTHDARLLLEGGYKLGTVTPVDQFVWSSHIELVADFSRT